ncbi:hypothetical protein MVES_000018 [Malassezia vespertilionis]|uniref:Uncharacterized protein n=1 Tax=Malassezia vespertilionis TaxID=2020962 RepID=A0A2N1JGK8_9BASI|nr:hypothetical protein MVES_000018 [Malassezia vespertilionis]
MLPHVQSAPENTANTEIPMEPVPTPDTVRDLTPNVCLSLVEFKGACLMRTWAKSRDMGTSAPPSLLQQHKSAFSSASAVDLGKSTYSRENESVCAAFWKELLDVWLRREDTIRYCIAVNARNMQLTSPSSNPDDRLDMDRAMTPQSAPSSRGESQTEFVTRQLQNELSVESIIRCRSLEAFKSRCRLFTPHFDSLARGGREKAFWEGR